jgi:hypothetical protein
MGPGSAVHRDPDDAEPGIGRAFARPVGIAGRTLRRVRDTRGLSPIVR